MKRWKIGDDVSHYGIIEGFVLDTVGGCKSPACEAKARQRHPNFIGFGRHVDGDIVINQGKVAGVTNLRWDEYECMIENEYTIDN